MNKKFIDSSGKRGASYVSASHKTVFVSKKTGGLKFGLGNEKQLKVYLPDGNVKMISKIKAIQLAHWLLHASTGG